MSTEHRYTLQLHTHIRLDRGGYIRIDTLSDNGREIGTRTTYRTPRSNVTSISYARKGVEYATRAAFLAAYEADPT